MILRGLLSPPKPEPTAKGRFIEHYAPRMLPAIPLKESGIVFVGNVLKVQPYLSENRTHVYTEMIFRVEDLFKYPPTFTLEGIRTSEGITLCLRKSDPNMEPSIS